MLKIDLNNAVCAQKKCSEKGMATLIIHFKSHDYTVYVHSCVKHLNKLRNLILDYEKELKSE